MLVDPLRAPGDAFIACYAAWLYPEDHEVRESAVLACAAAGVDYIALLAHTIEEGHTPDGKPFTAETARYAVAATWLNLTEKQYQQHGWTPPLPAFDPDAEQDPFDPRSEGDT